MGGERYEVESKVFLPCKDRGIVIKPLFLNGKILKSETEKSDIEVCVKYKNNSKFHLWENVKFL
jgi:hypothetical protein